MRLALLFSIPLFLAGCASAPGSDPKDPFEAYNRKAFKFNQALDNAVLKPLAHGYDNVTPQPAKVLIHNFFSNLDDVTVTLNDLLQFKFKQALSDGMRVVFNTTFGILGFANVTDRLEKHNEDFGQTLGYWGVPSGSYIMLPFFGPSTIRDGFGLAADGYTGVITNIRDVPTRNSLYAADKVEDRAQLIPLEKTLEEASDRYAFVRDYYLARRQSLVYDGDPPREKYIDEED